MVEAEGRRNPAPLIRGWGLGMGLSLPHRFLGSVLELVGNREATAILWGSGSLRSDCQMRPCYWFQTKENPTQIDELKQNNDLLVCIPKMSRVGLPWRR